MPFSVVEAHRRFGGMSKCILARYLLRFLFGPEDVGSIFDRSVGALLPNYTAY
jgi:hypothetical protein